jgi:hypothetical protein
MFQVSVQATPKLNVITVRAPKDVMTLVADTIKRFDVPAPPKKDVDLTIYLLGASNAADAPVTQPIPTALQPVVNQLKNVLSYKMFQLIDTQVVRGTDGTELSTSGNLTSLEKSVSAQIMYNFHGNLRIRTGDPKGSVIYIDRMRFGLRVPVPTGPGASYQYVDVGISSDVEIVPGQQVVIGKTTVGDTALILVINAKLLD